MKRELYDKSDTSVLQFLEIAYLISKLEEFERLKIVLFSKEQLAIFNLKTIELISVSYEISRFHYFTE